MKNDNAATEVEQKHLWEYDHPYYCNEGNYLASPVRDAELNCWQEYESWQDFYDDWGDTDPDLNLLFRWDWKAWHLEWPEDYPDEEGRTEQHQLLLYFMLQRKAFNKSIYVTLTADDEPAVRKWLTQRARTMAAIWSPLLGGVSDD